MHCPKCGSIINNDAEECKFCKQKITKEDRLKDEQVKNGKEKIANFTWFNWLILIASALLFLLYLPSLIINLLSGSFYVSGQPEKSILVSLAWEIVWGYAFYFEINKYKKVKAYKNKIG